MQTSCLPKSCGMYGTGVFAASYKIPTVRERNWFLCGIRMEETKRRYSFFSARKVVNCLLEVCRKQQHFAADIASNTPVVLPSSFLWRKEIASFSFSLWFCKKQQKLLSFRAKMNSVLPCFLWRRVNFLSN